MTDWLWIYPFSSTSSPQCEVVGSDSDRCEGLSVARARREADKPEAICMAHLLDALEPFPPSADSLRSNREFAERRAVDALIELHRAEYNRLVSNFMNLDIPAPLRGLDDSVVSRVREVLGGDAA